MKIPTGGTARKLSPKKARFGVIPKPTVKEKGILDIAQFVRLIQDDEVAFIRGFAAPQSG